MGNQNTGNNVLFFFPSNINGMFYIFHSENHSVLLLCRNFFLLCIWDNHHKRHHKQEYVRYTISFSQPFRHPKIGEIKLVGFAFLFHFYYIASFLKNGRAVRLTSDVIRMIPLAVAYRSISFRSMVAMPLP